MTRWILAAFIALASLAPSVSARAAQDDPRLARLFVALRSTQSPGWAQFLEQSIQTIWTESTDPETNRLMEQGLTAMAADETQAALTAFNEVVTRQPNYAEGWNKRATAEYLLNDFDHSIADIQRTLQLEPRHFGALTGLGEVYMAQGNKAAAIKAFDAALAIDPHLDDVKERVDRLQSDVGGNPT
jgi:tetratricopeptide (TPR) repeat protein